MNNCKPWSICLSLGLLAAVPATAQQSESGVQVIGPQSTVERYDAPVLPIGSAEGMIDFPSLISAPGADDGIEIMPSFDAVTIEILGTGQSRHEGEFVDILGQSRADNTNRDALYAALRDALFVYQGLPLTLGDVRFIQQDITDAYRSNGYPLLSVIVPPQEIANNHLRVQVNEFRLAELRLSYGRGDGNYSDGDPRWSDPEKIQARFEPVLEAPILNQQSLDDAVEQLNRSPFRSARVVFEPGTELGQSIANVQIDEQRPWSIQGGYNNHATESSGTNRYSLSATLGNILGENNQLSLNATFGDSIEEFSNYSAVFTVPNRWGHTFTLNTNYSDTASSTIPGIDSASTSLQMTADYRVPLRRGDSWELYGNAAFSLKQFERASLFGGTEVGGAEYDGAQLSAGLTLNLQREFSSNQISATVFNSLAGITDLNNAENYRRFYNSADGDPESTHISLSIAHMQQLGVLGDRWSNWRTETQISAQYAITQLAGSDNFALGGPGILRAYQSSEGAGDRGAFINQTLHFPPLSRPVLYGLIQNVQWSAFVESGTAEFENGGSITLWDAGLGMSLQFRGNTRCNFTLAVAGEDSGQTQSGDSRFFAGCNFSY
ncbi:ShlB/FhaC/HecB family hemolysin secretion/activation protein [Pseudohongiella sp. SYSU M77423]|uniref:ShlB/FhaC/HecB family hemolysin secretion/activation protein n=1 Tax=Pseudohongiella sp. SYSU M77423 TaxID=3042312 RepID=UPI0024810DAC|nr:ShlB/FhaC/HecB family hemolysin secretion/activation protein [Pseudohongiella sp. SYSU M77423]MDH7943742.1 ShlB/FhaC/HecB family hemolysin secretion/activation protein [Pseudohongiella sp. SYSU M77423]